MAYISNAVKQQLQLSRTSGSNAAVKQAYKILEDLEESAGTGSSGERNISNELYILCAEAAIEKDEWDLAEKCLKKFNGKHAPTRSLEARAFYCEGLVGLNAIPKTLQGKAKAAAHLHCATKIVTGIKYILEEWPKESETLNMGMEYLWRVLKNITNNTMINSLLEIFLVVVTLHEKLSICGTLSHLQWIVRYANCLRLAGRVPDALNLITSSTEMVVRVASERLQLQFFRIQVAFSISASGTKLKLDNFRPVIQAVHVVHSFFGGALDDATAKHEISQAFERLISDPEKKDMRPKGRKLLDTEVAFRDPALLGEIFAEVTLALAMCGADELCVSSMSKLNTSEDPRQELFAACAKAIMEARACGSLAAGRAFDASYLTKNMANRLLSCISKLEEAIDTALIAIPSWEVVYPIEVSCVILWNLCLPLLQPETRGRLRGTLAKILKILTQCNSRLSGLIVRAGYESALVEFEEDDMHFSILQIDKALSVEPTFANGDSSALCSVDLAMNWLKRRALVRRVQDTAELSSEEDHVIHLIEQARTSSSKSSQVVLLQAACSRLPPLTRAELNTDVKAKRTSITNERVKNSKSRKQDTRRESAEELFVLRYDELIKLNIYYLLLVEATSADNPALDSVVVKAASGIVQYVLPNDGCPNELLVMKAEACIIMSKILEKKSRLSSNGSEDSSSPEAMQYISRAAQTGVKLCTVGYSGGYLVVNACISLINEYGAMFKRGIFLPAASALRELYTALCHVNADPVAEFRLYDSIGFGYIMSLLQTHIAAKGEVNGELHCKTLSEALHKVYMFPICEENGEVLKRAWEACHQMMIKWMLPFRRKNFSLILPCINRLLGKPQEISYHPQEQLLFLLGRLSGPMEINEKKQLINTECVELLRADPSVELCARLAIHSAQIPRNEKTTLEICRTADRLYREGRLGWCTKSFTASSSPREKPPQSTVTAAPLTNSVIHMDAPKSTDWSGTNGGLQQKPTEMDWYWYSCTLLHQAALLQCIGKGSDRERHTVFQKSAIVSITNSAVAAANSVPDNQVSLITKAYHAFCHFSAPVTEASRVVVLSGLRILLSPLVLGKLKAFLCEGPCGKHHSEYSDLCVLICRLAGCLFVCLLEVGEYEEGLQRLHEIYSVLPVQYHRLLCSYEAEFCTRLSRPISHILEKTKKADKELKAAVLMAAAKNAKQRSESMKAWRQALETLKEKPLRKAELIIHFSQWLLACRFVSRDDVVSLLLSGLSDLERMEEAHSGVISNESEQSSGGLARATHLTLTGSITARTLAAAQFSRSAASSSTIPGKGMPSLVETLIATRILYFLFVLAPIEAHDSKPFFDKRYCALTLLHYVMLSWRIVSLLLRFHEGDPTKTTQIPAPLEIPDSFHEWHLFHADPRHADIIRNTCKSAGELNTERLRGILLEVADYFLGEGMDLSVFAIYSWVEFSIFWQYGDSDPRAMAALRAVRLKWFTSAARCGWDKRCGAVHNRTLEPGHRPNVDEILVTVDPPAPRQPLDSSGLFEFSNFVGDAHRLFLCEAEEYLSLGRMQEAQVLCGKVKQCAMRIGDSLAVSRCHLLEAQVQVLRGVTSLFENNVPHAEEEAAKIKNGEMNNEGFEEVNSTISNELWGKMQLTRIDGLLALSRPEEAVSLTRRVLSQLINRAAEAEANSVEQGVAKSCFRTILLESAKRFVMILDSSFSRLPFNARVMDSVRSLLKHLQSQLLQYSDSKCRLASLRIRQCLRPYVDDVFLDQKKDMDKGLALELLTEYKDILVLGDMLKAELEDTVPISTVGNDVTTHTSVSVAYNELLVLCARNCLERKLMKKFVLRCFHALTIDDLNVPTGGPKELEEHVVSYMRDPSVYEHRKKRMSANCPNIEYRITSYDDEEMCSALMHFGIPVGFRKKTSSVHIEGLLHFVTGSTASISPLQMEAHIMVSHTEFYRRLGTLGLTMETAEPGVGDGFKKGLRETEGKVLNHHWSINPIRVPCQTSPGKHHAAEQRVPRNHAPPPVDCSTPVVNQWIDTNSNLESLLLEGIRQARHMFDYGKMRMCYEYLAHDLILSNRPIAAGTAIEFSQAASMYSFIGDIVTSLGGKTPEATLVRLINKMKLETPHLVNTKAFGSVRDALLEMSPMWRRFDQIGEWPRESDKADPLPADMFTFTAVREYSTSYFLVALRRPDGDVYSRRVLLNLEDLRECTSTIESVKRLRKEDIASRSLSGSKTSAIKWEEIMRSYLERVRAVASPLWGDFLPLLTSQRPSSCTLCLCLDPILQPLPLEKLSEFSSFAVVCRELSVPHIRHKTQLRNAKQLSGSSLFVIDPFGEYAADTPPLSGEGRGKTNNIDIITFQREGNGASSRPSLAYIRNALATKSYVNLLVNMCGSLADILQPKDVSQLHLDHMQIAIAFMGTKETSYCREQRNEACKNALNVFYERQDVMSLLLLARGVHLAIQNIFSLTAEECSALCKRCLPLPGSGGGKTMSDVLKAVGVDSEDPCSFFVIYGTSQIGKPKGTS